MNTKQLVCMQDALNEIGIDTKIVNGRLHAWDDDFSTWSDVTDWSLSSIITWIKG